MFPHRQRQRIVREPNLAEKQVYAKHIRDGAISSVHVADLAVSKLADGDALALLRTASDGTSVEWGSAGQIAFPATQNASANANTLDDYEEGTWTPSVGGTATYTTQIGTYTKIGRVVLWFMNFKINAIGTGSQSIISGLPFTAATNSMNAVAYWSGLALSIVHLGALASGTSIVLYSATAAATGLISNNVLGNGAEVIANGIFEV